jgi:hypothetical protein
MLVLSTLQYLSLMIGAICALWAGISIFSGIVYLDSLFDSSDDDLTLKKYMLQF